MSETTTIKQRIISTTSSTTNLLMNGYISSTKSLKNSSKNNSIYKNKSKILLHKKSKLSILWPSVFLNTVFGPRIYRLILYCTYLFWFTCGVFVLKKTEKATAAINYVRRHADTVSLESIENSLKFKNLIQSLDGIEKPPAFLLLNQHALNMTFNFLCNTAIHPNVHERLIFVTLDSTARDVLHDYWPNIKQFYWPTESLYKSFSFAEGPYQLIYLLRANLAVALIKNGKSFWMMQQDTFWKESLFDKELEKGNDFDALFDQIGADDDDLRAEWVNGANFFVKANDDTLRFFQAVANKLVDWYTPDMGIMIQQCHTWGSPTCKFISHKIAHSWEWMYTDQKHPPAIMQLDCETDGRSKLQELGKFGFHFTKEDGRTCNFDAVHEAARRMNDGKIEIGRHSWMVISWGKFQFRVYWYLVDCILWLPYIGNFLHPYMPLSGYVLMFTM